MDWHQFRGAFDVFAERAYLNAGTCGPLPRAAVAAATSIAQTGAREGRTRPYFEAMLDLRARQRAAYAERLGADPADVALTTCTSEGVVRVLAGLDLGPGDEVLTAPDEHPGVLGPLRTLRARRGVRIRTAPFLELHEAVTPATTLVVCSHVSWITGAVAPAPLARTGVPVLLDGAQGIGAVPVDVATLGCAFYAGSGQKWLCGPVGSGMLWISPAWRERVAELGATYLNLAAPAEGVDSALQPDARRHDSPAVSAETSAAAVAAHDVLAGPGWDAVHARAADLAEDLAERLAGRGLTVAPRGRTTLVSVEVDDPPATLQRLTAAGIVVRELPGTPYVRASVGAWNDEDDIERLVGELTR